MSTFVSRRAALHHIGFVVADITAGVEGFGRSLAAAWDGQTYDDPLQKARVTFLGVRPGDALIELVAPLTEDSPVQRFLLDRGGGLHHLCYEVEDLEQEIADAAGRRCVIVRRPQPAVAFDNRRIAWLFTPERLLVELLEASVSR